MDTEDRTISVKVGRIGEGLQMATNIVDRLLPPEDGESDDEAVAVAHGVVPTLEQALTDLEEQIVRLIRRLELLDARF